MCNGMIISNICRHTLTHRNLFKDGGNHSKDTDDLSQGRVKSGEDSHRIGKKKKKKRPPEIDKQTYKKKPK